MANFNIFEFFYDFFYKLIEYAEIIWNFLNHKITLNTSWLPEIGILKFITGIDLPNLISFSLLDIIANPIFILIMVVVVVFT